MAIAANGDGELIRGVILETSAVFQVSDDGRLVALHAGAEKLIIRLRYSGMRLVLVFVKASLSVDELKLLEHFDFSEFLRPLDMLRHMIISEWGLSTRSCLCLCTKDNASTFEAVQCNVVSVAPSSPEISEQLDRLPTLIARHNKMLGPGAILVGHCMKWSRELDFLKRNAMPMLPSQARIAFVPVQLNLPLDYQLELVDIMLNKATDEIIGLSCDDRNSRTILFSEGFRKLENYLKRNSRIRLVDPTERVMPLIDREATQTLLSRILPTNRLANGGRFRPPHSVKVSSFDDPYLIEKLQAQNVGLPAIVKPQIACGAAESHTMAVVFEERGYKGLPVPLPATIQEYVDHGSIIYKFYVVGDRVFYSKRKSTPDAADLRSTLDVGAPAIMFDSLKSLPIGNTNGRTPDLDVETASIAGTLLRKELGLTIIGFDVVVHAETRDHIVVDVNYFPTFRDVPDDEAVPAFWKALQGAA